MNGAVNSTADLAAGQTAGLSLMNRFAHRPVEQSIGKTAQDFEGMFMSQMLQPMFDTVGVDPLFGGGHGEEAMRGFLIQEYGKILSKGSHIGIAAAVQTEMTQAQQANAKTTTKLYGAAHAAGSLQ